MKYLLIALAYAHKAEFDHDQQTIDSSYETQEEYQHRLNLEKREHLKNEELSLQDESGLTYFQLYLQRYGIEAVISIVLLIMLLNWLFGRCLNHRKADKWLQSVTPVLSKQFPQQSSIEFDDTTSSTFEMILSGRASVVYCKLLLALE